MTTPEVLTGTEMKFDKNDVAIVAIAKIEEEIRKNIKQSKDRVIAIDDELNKLSREYTRDGKKTYPSQIDSKEKFFIDMIKKGKLEKEMGIKKDHHVIFGEGNENVYDLSLLKLDRKGKAVSSMHILQVTTALSKRQKEIIQESKKLSTERDSNVKNGVEWKKKLQDIPAAERQMKAVIIENELNKSKEGKALVELLKNNYMDRIKAIEM